MLDTILPMLMINRTAAREKAQALPVATGQNQLERSRRPVEVSANPASAAGGIRARVARRKSRSEAERWVCRLYEFIGTVKDRRPAAGLQIDTKV
jgi:hypothetical protein